MDLWKAFCEVNSRRRAVRQFTGEALDDGAVREVLREAMLAPSSGNLQPYRLVRVKAGPLKDRLARACNGQQAARTASELIVVAAGPRFALEAADAMASFIEGTDLEEKSKEHHQDEIAKFRKIVAVGGSCPFTLVHAVASLLKPALSLLPLGPIGSLNWCARGAAYAAMDLMLAASARGLDTCPMEGFSGPEVARALELPRRCAVAVVIAIGHRAEGARIEPRWRRDPESAIVER